MLKLNLRELHMDDNIAEKCLKSLVIPTGYTTDHTALKFFPETNLLLKWTILKEF